MEAVLGDNKIKEFIEKDIPKPRATNAQDLVEWIKCVAKAKMIILKGVQGHIFLNLHGKETPYTTVEGLDKPVSKQK